MSQVEEDLNHGIRESKRGRERVWTTKDTKGREIHEKERETPFALFAAFREVRVPNLLI